MEIKPDKRLINKSIWEIVVITFFIVLLAFLLQLIPYADPDIDAGKFTYTLWLIVFILVVLTWLISVPIVILWIKNLTYYLEEDKITIKKGILTKREQNIPYRMITDFMLERTLFDRWLSIGSIKIQTAGQTQNTSGYEGKLSGLLNWKELHETLQSNLSEQKETRTEKKSQTPQTAEQSILFELRKIRELLEDKSKD